MARDYNKKSKPSTTGKTNSPWLLVLFAFFLGYLGGNVFNLSQLTLWIKSQVTSREARQEVQQQPTVAKSKLPKPKFEFYTLLAGEEAKAPVVSKTATEKMRPPIAKTVAIPASPSKEKKENYIVQIASFNKKQDAERMKAELTLKGFSVMIKSVERQKSVWFRVILGPFANRIQAEKAQVAVARSEHVMGLIRKMDA